MPKKPPKWLNINKRLFDRTLPVHQVQDRGTAQKSNLRQDEQVFWRKLQQIDRQIVSELKNIEFYPIHRALNSLHNLFLKQQKTQKFDYQELYHYFAQKMEELHGRGD